MVRMSRLPPWSCSTNCHVLHTQSCPSSPIPLWPYWSGNFDHPFELKEQPEIPLHYEDKLLSVQNLQWFPSLSIRNPARITTTAFLGENKNRNIGVLLLGSNWQTTAPLKAREKRLMSKCRLHTTSCIVQVSFPSLQHSQACCYAQCCYHEFHWGRSISA